jgi:hypothetical protein
MPTDDDDKKVKDVLDAVTLAELQKWFALPTFEQVAEHQPPPPEDDAETRALRERRDNALAAVDPALLDRIGFRVETNPETLLKFAATIDVHVDPEIALFDHKMADNVATFADPREVEISEDLRDDLKDCTPQALLRDLHRSETEFEKTFEIVDAAAEQRMDIVAEVATAMRTSWKLPPLDDSPWVQSRRLLDAVRADCRRPWVEVLPQMPNRRVRE